MVHRSTDIDKSKPVVGVSRPQYVETEETMVFAYTTYDFMKSIFADKEVEVSFANDVKLGDDAKTVSEKFGGKYTKMAQDYLKTSFPASGAVYYTGRDDLSKEEAKAYKSVENRRPVCAFEKGML